jgi:peptidoglycan/xylan/chitin deacetylase (PgdA/CDA1 family)
MTDVVEAYSPDRSLKGKLRRRLARLVERRPASIRPERPMASFTFDDPLATATATGSKLLEARGLRGTYFVAAGLVGRQGPAGRYATAEEIIATAGRGHEVACHTYSHLDCGKAAGPAIRDDVERNAAALKAWGLGPTASFAYPYGEVSALVKRELGGRFGLLRAIHVGIFEDGGDLNQAPAVGIEGVGGERIARRWLGIAAARKGWLILCTHDVAETPSEWGCTPGALERLIEMAVASGFDVVTVAEGLRRLSA